MDVSLVLTHRCNLACGYCYAGEHYKREIDRETLRRSVDLMFADGADTVQLSFFGGEPFLNFEAMAEAVALAEARAEVEGRRLLIQCTTNGSVLTDEHVAFVRAHGIRTTVSIDGVQEAHDTNRPQAGGGSSFGRVRGGLRKLVDAGCEPDAMMVITPETTPHVYRSVSFLWGEGVRRVRANMRVDAPWTVEDRDELREQLLSVGWEQLARRSRGEPVSFEPFEAGMRRAAARHRQRAMPVTAPECGGTPVKRAQIVVGTGGNLYPCAPMVGEDRDDGPEAALRLGHIDDGAARISRRVSARGAGCGDGKGCACAAYLETGDRDVAGPNGRWFATVTGELGAAIADALAQGAYPPRPQPDKPSRRPFLLAMLAGAGGLAVGVPALVRAGLFAGKEESHDAAVGGIREPIEPPPEPPPEPIDIAGGISAPPEPPEPPEPDITVDGDIAAPPQETVRGDFD